MTDEAAREGYADLRPEVLGAVRVRLRRDGIDPERADLDAAWALAWHALLARRAAGEDDETPSQLLVAVADRHARRTAGVRTGATTDDSSVDPATLAVERDVEEAATDLVERSDEDELAALLLVRLHDRSPVAGARGLGRSPRELQRALKRTERRAAPELRAALADPSCPARRPLVRDFALGLLEPLSERHRLATAHLRECASCHARGTALRALAAHEPPAPLRDLAVVAAPDAVGFVAAPLPVRVGEPAAAAPSPGEEPLDPEVAMVTSWFTGETGAAAAPLVAAEAVAPPAPAATTERAPRAALAPLAAVLGAAIARPGRVVAAGGLLAVVLVVLGIGLGGGDDATPTAAPAPVEQVPAIERGTTTDEDAARAEAERAKAERAEAAARSERAAARARAARRARAA
ncbi:hypothetical protein SK069_18560, partial [Patulibacter brassicae]